MNEGKIAVNVVRDIIVSAQIKDVKKWVGKEIEWDIMTDIHRGVYKTKDGMLEEVRGRNLLVDGEWRWFPDMRNVRLKGESSPWLE